jgi:hypothetical protein
MDIETVRNRFSMRYYRWALEDARREVREDFSLMRKVKQSNLNSLLNWLELYSLKEQMEYFTAMIKHSHHKAASVAGATVSPQEEALIQKSRIIWMSPTKVRTDILQQKVVGTWRRCNQKKIALLVRKHAEPMLGKDVESSGTHGCRYQTDVPGFIIYTCINFGGRSADISYYQLITTPSGEKVKHSISLLAWLGIGETVWTDLTEADIEPAAEAVVEICRHFLNAARSLLTKLDGLD